MAHSTPSNPTAEGFDPVNGLLALAIPGLGYVVRKQYTRALLFAAGIYLLVVLGILLGGVDVVDRVEDKWWFIPQAGLGPLAFGLDHLHRNILGAQPGGVTPSIGKINEIGTLFVVMAGMMNLIAVFDCLWPNKDARPEADRRAGGDA
jgi:hypothetical protein